MIDEFLSKSSVVGTSIQNCVVCASQFLLVADVLKWGIWVPFYKAAELLLWQPQGYRTL